MLEPFVATDRNAYVRSKAGVYTLRVVHTRDGKDFIPHAGGFARICAKVGDNWLTSVSGLTVWELDEKEKTDA